MTDKATLQWHPVDSSMLSAIAHDATGLHARYKTGKVYTHPSVPRSKFDELLAAKSKGEYFNKNIKPYHPVGK